MELCLKYSIVVANDKCIPAGTKLRVRRDLSEEMSGVLSDMAEKKGQYITTTSHVFSISGYFVFSIQEDRFIWNVYMIEWSEILT